jgi:hypothetical protein
LVSSGGRDESVVSLGWCIPVERLTWSVVEESRDLVEIETLHLDRGYDYPKIRAQLEAMGLDDLNIQRRKPRGAPSVKLPMRFGLWWVVEGTNSWLSNCGQLRRNTDRRNEHRHAQLCLVTTLLINAELIDRRNRWSPESLPIR